MREGPSHIAQQISFQPRVSLLDGAVVHVIEQVGNDPGNGWQLSEVARETGEGQVVRGRIVGEISPWRMLASIFAGGADLRSRAWQSFGVTRERFSGREQFALQVLGSERVWAGIVGYTLIET